MSDHYLFAGSAYYPMAPPGDFVLRGTLEECRTLVREMPSHDPEGRVRFLYRHVSGRAPMYLERPDGDEWDFYESQIDWWRIVDADMQEVESGGRAHGE